jgi:RNA polymerase sigma-70 factor (ECF subfamily)
MALNRVSGWSELLDKMGQAEGDREEPPGSTPEPFEVFYLREYPKVVGLLHGLLGSRLVAEELAQETFLVAYRDWDRIGRLDNPRAWVRKVAINQRGSFLRAYLRQQTRERDAVVRYEDDSIKLADDHAEVWQAIRTLPPLQAQVIALHYYEDYSVAQVAAALGRAPGTIKAQLHHGRRKLARLLATDPNGGRST